MCSATEVLYSQKIMRAPIFEDFVFLVNFILKIFVKSQELAIVIQQQLSVAFPCM